MARALGAPGRAGLAATLANISNEPEEFAALEKRILTWPIPSGLSKSFSKIPVQIIIRKGRTGGFGIQLQVAGNGMMYVTGMAPDSPAKKEGVVEGMRVIEINGRDAAGLSEQEAVVIGGSSPQLALKLAYDPVGYGSHDGGDEVRRVSEYAFQGEWTGQFDKVDGGARYLGKHEIQGSPPPEFAIRKIMKDVKTAPRVAHQSVLDCLYGQSALVLTSKKGENNEEEYIFKFINLISMEVDGANVALVVNEADKNHTFRLPMCHVLECSSAAAAEDVACNIADRLAAGFERVKNAVNGTVVPPLMLADSEADDSFIAALHNTAATTNNNNRNNNSNNNNNNSNAPVMRPKSSESSSSNGSGRPQGMILVNELHGGDGSVGLAI
eukprot:m.273267 g.273267  ORF g.273267 m.273267 type:complete len:383 (+) comp16277_c0_seq1:172-1320(+)